MNSGKSGRKSRRSSILKAPKQRQPLQNVELSPSSNENSPATTTTKVKRRVSFAEKKHVKEFCDSVEQGTVWDNTYEESELSQMRNSQNSNNDENTVDIVERSNDPSIQQDAINSKSIDEKKASDVNSTRKRNKNLSDQKSSLPFIDIQSENKENVKIIVDHDGNAMECDLDLTDMVETVINPEEPLQMIQHGKISIFHDSFNEPQLEVLTTFSKIHETTQKQPNGESKKKTISEKRTIDFTNDRKNEQSVSDSSCNEYDRNEPKNVMEKTLGFFNKSMDFTEVVKNTISIDEPQKTAERTTIFHNASVEFTNIVQNIRNIEKSPNPPMDRSILYHNNTVDFTEVVQNIPSVEKPQKLGSEKTTILHNKTVDFPEVVQNISSIEKPQKFSPEKTTIFHNKSVDFTEVVQNIPRIEKPQKLSPEKTTIFHNKSVDFTEVVQNIPSIEKPQKLSPEKTTIFHNKSVDLTEVVQNIPSIKKPQKLSPEKTRIFPNTSVDFTEVVENMQNIEKPQQPESEKTTIFHDQFVDFTEIVPNIPSTKKQFFDKSRDDNKPEERTLLQDHSMKLTEVVSRIPSVSKQPLGFLNESSTRDEAVLVSLPSEGITDNRMDFNNVEHVDSRLEAMDSTVLHDESMEITRAIPSLLRSRKNEVKETSRLIVFNEKFTRPTESLPVPQSPEILPLSRKLPECDTEINGQSTAEGKTMIFRDASMELTNAVSLQTIGEDRSNEQEDGKCELRNFVGLEKEERTVVFHDDSMEITRAVKSSLQRKKITILDKENCPIGMEHLLQSETKSLHKEHGMELPQSKFIEMMKPVKFASLAENKENRMDLSESEEHHRAYNFKSDNISGVVPLSSQIGNLNSGSHHLQFSKGVDEIVALGSGEMEFTEAVPQISLLIEDRIQFPQVAPPLEEKETFHTGEKSYECSSHHATEFCEKSITNLEYIKGKGDENDVNDKDGLERRNSGDEIRQLAETFSLSNSNGFDEATFLKQQASCLRDHEANSTASQEFSSRTFSTNRDMAGGGSHDSSNPHCLRSSLIIERPELPTNDMIFSSKDTENRNMTIDERHDYSSTMNRGPYDKSLEELRSRAYSVRKFRPEETVCELTEGLILGLPGYFHENMLEDLQAEEPPSFVFAESLTKDPVDNVDSANGSWIGAQRGVHRENVECQESLEQRGAFYESRLVEKCSNTMTCVAPGLPEITETQEVYMRVSPNVTDDVTMEDRTERKGKHRSQTYVMRNGVSNEELSCTSSLAQLDNETDDKVSNHRHSNAGITTAAEFSSESHEGPFEKLFRCETVLPAEGHIGNAIISMEMVVPWDNRPFANSTVIGDDSGQHLMFQGTSDKRILAENSHSDELPSAFVSNEEKIVHQLTLMELTEGTNDMAANLENLQKSSFCVFKETIENLSNRSDIIWNINRLDEKIVAFNFFNKLIVIAIYLNENTDLSVIHPIKEVVLLSQLVKEKTDPGLCLAHSLIMKKINTSNLTRSCRNYEEIPQLLEYVSTEVKLGMDFAFELDRLRNHNVMEIHDNRITFMARTRNINAGIILNIAMEVKSFEEINQNDITVSCLLGSEKIRKNDIERLITNVKRDHRFLRFYMTDVRDYIDLMAETGFSKRS